jgi:TP901 family phage tail tape measure protein
MAVTTGDEFVIPISVKDEATAKLKMIQGVADSMAKAFTKMANDLTGASGKVQESAGKMRSALKGAGDGAGSSGGMFTLFGKNIGSLPSKIFMVNQALELVTRTFRTFATLGTAVMGPAIALEKGAATINAIVPDVKDAQKTFSSDIINFQRLFGTSQQDIIEAYYKTLSSGIVSANDATKFLYDAQRLAIGGSTELSVSVRALTSVIAAYNMKASDAARISDILTLAERNGQATMTDLALTIGDVAPLAYNMGVSLGETASALSAMTTAQQDTGQAMTYLRSILVSFMKQSELLGTILPTLKIDGKQFSGIQEMLKSVGLLKTMKALIEAVGGQAEAVGNLIGRQEGIQGLITMIMNPAILGVYEKTMAQIKATEGIPGTVVGQAVDIQMKTVDRKLMILKGTFTALIQDFGYKLLDVTARVITGMREVIDAVYPVVVAFAQALQRINWSAATKGAKEFGLAIIFLTFAMSGALVVMAKFTLLTMTVMAFGTAIEYIYRNRNNLGDAFEIMKVKADMARNAFEYWVESIKNGFSTLLVDAFASFLSGVTDFMAGFVGLFGFSQDAIRKWSDEVIVKLKNSGPDLLGHKDKVQTLNDEYAKLNTRLNELRKTVQTPFVFTMSDNLTSAMKGFNDDVIKNGTALDAFFKKLQGQPDTNAVPGESKTAVAKKVPYIGMTEKDINSIYKGTNALTKLDAAYFKILSESQDYKKALATAYAATYGDDSGKITSSFKEADAAAKKYHEAVAETYNLIGTELLSYETKQAKIDEARAEAQGNYIKAFNRERNEKTKAYDDEISSIQRAIEAQRMMNERGYNTTETMELGKEALIKLEKYQNDLIKDRLDMLDDLKKKEAATTRKTKIAPAVEKGGAVFNSAQIEQAGANFGAPLANGMASFTSFMGGPMGMVSAAGMIMDAIKSMINAIAELPQKFLDLLDAVSSFPGKVANTFNSAAKTFGDLVSKGSVDTTRMFQSWLDMFPNVIDKVMDSFVKTFSSEKFWASIGKMMASLLLFIPKIVLSIIKGVILLVKNIGPIIKTMVKAFVDGFILEFKKFINEVAALFKMKPIFNIPDVTKKVEELGEAVSKSSSQLFSVMESAQKAKGSDLANRIKKAIDQSLVGGANYLKMIWNKALQYLKDIWLYVWNHFLKPFVDVLQNIWDTAEKAWRDICAELTRLWSLIEYIWRMFCDTLQSLWGEIEIIWRNICDTLTILWSQIETIWRNICDALTILWSQIETIWRNVFDAFYKALEDISTALLKAAGDIVAAFTKGIEDTINAFSKAVSDIANAFTKGLEDIGKAFADVGSDIWNSFTTALSSGSDIVSGIGTKIFNGLKDGLDGARDFFKGIGSSIWDGMKDAFNNVSTGFKKILDDLNPASLLGKIFKIPDSAYGKGTVEGALGIDIPYVSFAEGGKVPGNALVSGDSERNDRILALLSPGEAIIPRSKMQDPRIAGIINSILSGNMQLPKFAMGFPKVKVGGTLGDVIDSGKDLADSAAAAAASAAAAAAAAASQALEDAAAAAAQAVEDSKVIAANIAAATARAIEDARIAAEVLAAQIAAAAAAAAEELKRVMWDTVKTKATSWIMDMFRGNAFSRGGMVPAFADGGYINSNRVANFAQGTDSVPSMLTPGEFVVNRNSTKNNLGLLQSINNGGSPLQSSGGTVINVTINSRTLLDADQIRREVVPEIEKELKKKSQMGRYILSSAGVR